MRNHKPAGTTLLSALIAALIIGSCQSSKADLDTITREIKYENGVIWVEDDLHISEKLSKVQGELWYVFSDIKDNGVVRTNLEKHVVALMKKESLEVQTPECRAAYKSNFLDLHILSKVKFDGDDRPAKLCLVPSLGGLTVDFEEQHRHPEKIGEQKYMGGRIQNEMLVSQKGGKFILWFPDLGPADLDLEYFDVFRDQFETRFHEFNQAFGITNNHRYVCNLKIGNQRINLLDWTLGEEITNVPDVEYLRRMNKMHKMSENDLISLCTSMKIAKGGYYNLN